jgi:tRNA G18 (ribose-2'-O)-methylase SpoU
LLNQDCQCPYPDCGALSSFSPRSEKDDSPLKAHNCPQCGRKFSPRSLAQVEQLLSANAKQKRKLAAGEDLPFAGEPPDPRRDKLVVVADNIRSLHNVGAIFRTADAAGFSYLYLCGMTGVPPRNEIAKVSLGSETWLPFRYEVYLPAAVLPLKQLGYNIVALEKCPGSTGLYESLVEGRLQLPLALIVGNEVGGLSHEGVALSDNICHLSMRGKKESLNVSVAFGVASYFLAEHLL